MSTAIKKAVFPVAGLGTRFLPATKANPKEMLPIVDKPLIQYAVEEAVKAGIEELIFVTSSSKRAIEDHFDSNFELESTLREKKKFELLELVQNILPRGISCSYVRQSEQLGLGHAVGCARSIIGREPFAVLLADDLIVNGGKNCLEQMLEIYKETSSSVLAVQKIDKKDSSKYGIVDTASCVENHQSIDGIVEKPLPQDAPSDLAVVGRYILTPEVLDCLNETAAGAIGEIQLTDAIAKLLDSQKVYVCPFVGTRYDCGNKLGFLQATVELGLKHPEVGAEFKEYLSKRV
ncbi:MAG: UTP--glucose-1-phosphate uridylyltransferase GalU [Gammaproteobacteria bacterium]|nr:UTP--glucose-1-phosphate uridylyltransferase GalU [Gammaproteobacteria bacterium]